MVSTLVHRAAVEFVLVEIAKKVQTSVKRVHNLRKRRWYPEADRDEQRGRREARCSGFGGCSANTKRANRISAGLIHKGE